MFFTPKYLFLPTPKITLQNILHVIIAPPPTKLFIASPPPRAPPPIDQMAYVYYVPYCDICTLWHLLCFFSSFFNPHPIKNLFTPQNFYFTHEQIWGVILYHTQQNFLLHHPQPRPPIDNFCTLQKIWWIIIAAPSTTKIIASPTPKTSPHWQTLLHQKNLVHHYCTTSNKTFITLPPPKTPPFTKWLMYGMCHNVMWLMYTMLLKSLVL